MQAEIQGDNLVITIPINPKPFPPSSTGKSLIFASSNGNVATGLTVDGKQIKIGLNAFLDNR